MYAPTQRDKLHRKPARIKLASPGLKHLDASRDLIFRVSAGRSSGRGSFPNPRRRYFSQVHAVGKKEAWVGISLDTARDLLHIESIHDRKIAKS